MYVQAIFWGFRLCTPTCLHFLPALPLSTGLPILNSSLFLSTFFSYLLLYITAKSLLSAPLCLLLSFPAIPLSDSSTGAPLSLSVSLFCDCSGWSPCGTPCRVPNLFIISALCRDARGMLKYTPPRSGYKWAGVSNRSHPLQLPNWHGHWDGHTVRPKPRRRILKSYRLRREEVEKNLHLGKSSQSWTQR